MSVEETLHEVVQDHNLLHIATLDADGNPCCYVSVPATSLATRSLSWRLSLFPMFGVPFRARPYRSVERNT
jgi:hypothetical protein